MEFKTMVINILPGREKTIVELKANLSKESKKEAIRDEEFNR